MGDGTRKYNIIAVGDPQPRSDAHFKEFADRPLKDLCRTVSKLEGETVGIVLGDICYDVLPLQKRWKEEIVRTGIPFYPCVGNHDHDRAFEDDALSIHAYRSNFGPENYAFFIGKDLVIVLDDIIYYSRSGYNVAAICGTWWDTYHCTDGTPRGYKVFTKEITILIKNRFGKVWEERIQL